MSPLTQLGYPRSFSNFLVLHVGGNKTDISVYIYIIKYVYVTLYSNPLFNELLIALLPI